MPKINRKENPQAFKHMLNEEFLQRIGTALAAVYPAFNQSQLRNLRPQLEKLELKPRVQLVRDELHRQLPSSFAKACKILLASLKHGEFKSFDLWCYSEFIQTYGLAEAQTSLRALKILTPLFTSEFAVRPFLKKYPRDSMEFLLACARDKNVHLRRWASEGTRPRLPWGERLHAFIADPKATAPILELLKFDEELYVRKSVANHLNDIAKDHPDYVIKLLQRWSKAAPLKHREKIDWIIRQSLRTLIKNGNAQAMKLLGVNPQDKIRLNDFKLAKKKLKLGERLDFCFEITSQEKKNCKLVIDYVIYYKRANATTSPKVFKLKNVELKGGEKLRISKSHHVKEVTTRKHYAGKHALAVQVNGLVLAQTDWSLSL